VEFIEALDVTKLKIKKEDYDKAYNQHKVEFEKSNFKDAGKEESKVHENVIKNPSTEIEESIVSDRHIAKRINDIRPFAKYEIKEAKFHNSEFTKLTVNDLEELFNEYKKLCLLHQKATQKIENLVTQVEEKTNNPTKKPAAPSWTRWIGK